VGRLKLIKLKNLSIEETASLIPEGLVLLAYRGSIAHGLYQPNHDPDSIDDRDLMGVFIHPLDHYLGFGYRKVTSERWLKEYDCVFYELSKFMHLLSKSNPNVMSLLWVDRKHLLFESEIGRKLRENRDLFSSKEAYHSFTGYARSQLKKMTHLAYEGYMGEKRKALVDKHGYDTKNASHLIRLLKMGLEFLVEGRLYVERTTDAQYLLDIKKGVYELDYIKSEAERLFALVETAYVESKLPAKPDVKKIEALLMKLISDYHSLTSK
jgi:predicted nucleotidyltransferase